MMKIAYIAKSPVPSQAANGVHVVKMAHALAFNGHEVILYTPLYNSSAKGDSADIYRYYGVSRNFRHKTVPCLRFPKLRRFSHDISLATMLVFERPDLVYTRDLRSALLACRLNIPVIYERHDSFSSADENARFQRLLQKKSLCVVVVISQALKKELCRIFSIEDHRVLVAPDGADIISGETRKALPDADRFRAGYAGHLYEGRGIDVLCAVAARLPDIEFHLVGGVAQDVARWKERAVGLGNLFFHGYVSPADVPGYLISFDVLLAPYQNKVSVHGGGGDTAQWMSPLKIFEYMAAEKPMIVSNIPVLREVLHDGENCLMCEAEDVGEWIQAVQKLKDDRDCAQRIARQAYQDLSNRYSWNARAKEILSHIET